MAKLPATSPEFANFESLAKRILTTPKAELVKASAKKSPAKKPTKNK